MAHRRRDPETGQFVSTKDQFRRCPITDMDHISGRVSAEIPAADLSGGTGTSPVETADATELIDFTGVLDSNEVFQAVVMQVSASLGLPTTATAESSGFLMFEIGTESDIQEGSVNPHYGGGVEEEVDIVDVSVNSTETDTLFQATLYGEASHSDTTNSLAGGADYENDIEFVNFASDWGIVPTFDEDDELHAPFRLGFENISDHAIVSDISVVLHGYEKEIEC